MWHPNAKFPNHLKDAIDDSRKLYFDKGFYLKHRGVMTAYDELRTLFFDTSEKDVILIQGPTGVGKTCLSQKLMFEFYKDEKVKNNRISALPMVYVEADVLGGSSFSWKDFYADILLAMGELENTNVYGEPRVEGVDGGRVYSAQNRTEKTLKRDVLSRIKEYDVKFILIDEIQHIFKYGGKSGEKNMDILKGMANISGCRFIGLGTYEISFSLARSAQLARRVGVLDYPAYSLNRSEDIDDFGAAYLGLLAHMPIELDPIVIKNVKSVFLGSCGCIGILKEWLGRALSLALKEKKKMLTISHLRETKLHNSQLKIIAEEIREGEAFFEEPEDEELWGILGGLDGGLKPKPKKTTSKYPGRRNPTRDKVGMP